MLRSGCKRTPGDPPFKELNPSLLERRLNTLERLAVRSSLLSLEKLNGPFADPGSFRYLLLGQVKQAARRATVRSRQHELFVLDSIHLFVQCSV